MGLPLDVIKVLLDSGLFFSSCLKPDHVLGLAWFGVLMTWVFA
ncbi:hypothetical protein DsansV1_C05g0052641 [Dioscorea sansibarensis]